MICIILKHIISKKDKSNYYKIGIRVYKNGIKILWYFIPYSLYCSYFNFYDIVKVSTTEYCITHFLCVKEVDYEEKKD